MNIDFLILAIILAIISSICGGVISLKVMSFLSGYGIKLNYWLLKFYMLKYLQQYRKLTIEENGKPGSLFYAFIVSWSLTLGFYIILIVLLI